MFVRLSRLAAGFCLVNSYVVLVIFRKQRQMATAGVFDIELNEDGTNDSDHSDEEPIKPASEEHVQVMIVICH